MSLLKKKDLNPEARLTFDERLAFGAGNFGGGFANNGISVFMLFYFTNYVGLNAGIVGTILLVSRVLDGISDLIMGAIVDRTHTKQGKARPWLLRSCIPFAIATVALFSVPGDGATVGQYIYIAVVYNLLNTVFTTMFSVPYQSLNCLMTKNQYERGLLGVFSMLGLVVAQFVSNGFTFRIVDAFGDTRLAWTITFAIYAAIGLASQLFCYFNTRERVSNASDPDSTGEENKIQLKDSLYSLFHNSYWVRMAIIVILIQLFANCFYGSVAYYATYVLGNKENQSVITNAMLVTQIIFMLLAFLFIRKFGKGGSLKIGGVIITIGFLIDAFAGSNLTVMIIGTAVAGVGNGIAASQMGGIFADTVEYGEWKHGIRTEGMAYAAMSTAQKIGAGLAAAIIGGVLNFGHFDATLTVQPASAIAAIRFTTVILPLLFLSVILILSLTYDLDKKMPQILADLEERHKKA